MNAQTVDSSVVTIISLRLTSTSAPSVGEYLNRKMRRSNDREENHIKNIPILALDLEEMAIHSWLVLDREKTKESLSQVEGIT